MTGIPRIPIPMPPRTIAVGGIFLAEAWHAVTRLGRRAVRWVTS